MAEVRPWTGDGDWASAVVPGQYHAAVTPSDSADLSTPCRGLWVGGAGDVKLTLVGGTTATLSSVPAGTLLPVRATRVWSTGTTATLMTALW